MERYYRGTTKTGPPKDRTKFGNGADWNHRQCFNCGGIMNPTECPNKEDTCLVWHGWKCSQCGGDKVDEMAFEASMCKADYYPSKGFIYAPYYDKEKRRFTTKL